MSTLTRIIIFQGEANDAQVSLNCHSRTGPFYGYICGEPTGAFV